MSFTTKQIKEIIMDIEARFPVETWELQGIHIWPLVRVQLYLDLFHEGRNEAGYRSERGGLRYQIEYALGLFHSLAGSVAARIKDSSRNSEIRGYYDAVFFTYTVHRTPLNGVWYDKYCDPFVDALDMLNLKSLVLELSLNRGYVVPRYGKSAFIEPSVVWSIIKSRLRSKHLALPGDQVEGYNDLRMYLEQRGYGINIPHLAGLRVKLNAVRELSVYFKKILLRVKPKIVFIAEYYSLIGAALTLACRDAGIPSVDIQHGLQGDEHLAYGSFTRVPPDGYEVLPSFFWCWSDYEAGTIRKWNAGVSSIHQPYIGGNLWMNLWRSDPSSFVRRYDALVSGMKSASGKSVFVLFTPSLMADTQDWIFEAVKHSPTHYQWWIRVHPCKPEMRDFVRNRINMHNLTNVELDRATDLPLLALLRHADVNITAFSSTVHEAAEFGVPSVLTDPQGLTLFTEQIVSGLAVAAYDTGELLRSIERQVSKKASLQKKRNNVGCDNVKSVSRFLEIVLSHGAPKWGEPSEK